MEMADEKRLQVKTLSSLTKIVANRIYGSTSKGCQAAHGQEVSFQIAYRFVAPKYTRTDFSVEVDSPLAESISLFRVESVPVELAAYPERHDQNYLSLCPGLFPDPLIPLEGGTVRARMGLWQSLWVSVRIPEGCDAKTYPIQIRFCSADGIVAKCKYQIEVQNVDLPKQKLLYTQWFHCDCIADAHGVSVFSEEHWRLIGEYMQTAAEHGMNMILTPVVTPPLDTAIGSERPTVQLVGIVKDGDRYTFDFTRLKRYIHMALDCGIGYFEISHLFTQWGVAHAPKVVATVNGEEKRIFGWETDACSNEYVSFLRQFVPAMLAFLKSEGVTEDQLWFHVSDEPSMQHLDAYRAGADVLRPLIGGCHHMDALSDYEFYKEGLLETPVVATNHIETYLDAKVPNLWCYYCCGQGMGTSNRFLAMPSARTRIIGVQMYKYGIKGFLQWGYNFYYTARSEKLIDPWKTTDGECSWPAGDPFSVYPYGDGVIPSIRQKVFAQALEDMRLLNLLDEKLGHDRVVAEIEKIAGCEITFSQAPSYSGDFFDRLYDFIFTELNKA